MKRVLLAAAGATAALLATASLVAGGELVSLRGSNPIDELSKQFEEMGKQKSATGFKRSWKTAPPMIPHSAKAFKVTMKLNVCAYCHVEDYKWMEAPKAGDSHFLKDASGKATASLDARRYFCTQCHATQTTGGPLVANTF